MDRNFALEQADLAAGFVLTCQSHPLTERVVRVASTSADGDGPRWPARVPPPTTTSATLILARAARAVRAPRLHRDDDERGGRRLRHQQGHAVPLRARQARACWRRSPPATWRGSKRWCARSRPQRLAPAAAAARADPTLHARPTPTPQHEHRVLTEDVKFLADAERARGRRRPAPRRRRLRRRPSRACGPTSARRWHTPLAMLLFGMINWTFTWLKPGGALTHDDAGADGGRAVLRRPAGGACTAGAEVAPRAQRRRCGLNDLFVARDLHAQVQPEASAAQAQREVGLRAELGPQQGAFGQTLQP